MTENRLKLKSSETYRFRKPLDQMGIDELCAEAVRIRDLMVDHSEKLNEIYTTLYSKARRVSDEAAYSYISIANSGKRFSGMVHQAARRTAGVENRILTVVARDLEDRTRQRQVEAERLAREVEWQKSASSAKDPLEVLYGIPRSVSDERDVVAARLPVATLSDIEDLYGEELS
jgi:hypothetical protein